MRDTDVDCLIVGGGPAGLTAAVYLGRFRRRTLVIDAGGGRASLISNSHNFPGAVSGISGSDLLVNLLHQAQGYGVEIRKGRVSGICRERDHFVAKMENFFLRAAKVLLATGVTDKTPLIPQAKRLIYRGRYPILPYLRQI